MDRFTFIDLFAGIGGFKMALSANGGKCVGFSEVNKDAINAYCENHNIKPESNFGDITKIKELPYHDILTGGVPCQSWSIAGKNLGFDDDRGQLWNDTIYLLNQARPKSFIFENVKGLVDPRNKKALSYILDRIKEAGYFASYHVINSHDYGVAQNRVRIYLIGFREKEYFEKFRLPKPIDKKITLADILGIEIEKRSNSEPIQKDLFGNQIVEKQMSLSSKNGFNDYFLFNDLRNGHSTIHSWDITETKERQKEICLLLLKNRRKSQFGPLDGNPLSLKQFQQLDSTITIKDLQSLVDLEILKKVDYRFEILDFNESELEENEIELLNHTSDNILNIDELKSERKLKVKRISISDTIATLLEKKIVKCVEERFDFKNTKISSGLNGVNRIFMPSSDVFPTLVASDTNDYVSLKDIEPSDHFEYREQFLKQVYFSNNYRKITKEEACLIQGFPKDFKLPESRARWMKLIGNSVSVPVIDNLIKAIISTGVF
ncbi:MAG: DNA cytosine methyltransferase [Bacteroidetes bacterium]|nr:DNA cytosine methyltransferase [Bacteroidota bacterium]